MKAAIMQPTYLPWLGYFDLIDSVDAFVFLDHVQFVKQSWHQRNRIRGPEGPLWLSIPVQTSGRLGQKLADTRVLQNGWQRKHLASISYCYRRAPYTKVIEHLISEALLAEKESLVAINETIIREISSYLGMRTPFLRSSSFPLKGKKQEMLASLCMEIGATTYISPLGSAGYLGTGAYLNDLGIDVAYQHYEHPTYSQLGEGFFSYLSIVDLLCMASPSSALESIRSGHRNTYTPSEAILKFGQAGTHADETEIDVLMPLDSTRLELV